MNSAPANANGYLAAWYKSPIDLPEGKSGTVSIAHRIIKDSTPIISARQAYTRGLRSVSAKPKEPLRVHELRCTIRNRFGARPIVHCWAEDIMIGQIRRSLEGPHRFWKYKRLPLMTPRQIERFLSDVGLPQWEKLYGGLV